MREDGDSVVGGSCDAVRMAVERKVSRQVVWKNRLTQSDALDPDLPDLADLPPGVLGGSAAIVLAASLC